MGITSGQRQALVRGCPPGRPLRDRLGLLWPGEERVQGDPRGPGGPPYRVAQNSKH